VSAGKPQAAQKLDKQFPREMLQAASRETFEKLISDASYPTVDVFRPRLTPQRVFRKISASSCCIGAYDFQSFALGSSAVIMMDDWPWIIPSRNAGPDRSGHSIDIFARKSRSGAKPFVKPADPLERCSPECHVGAVNYARRNERFRLKAERLLGLLDCHPIIRGIKEQYAPPYETRLGVLVEDLKDGIQIVFCRVTIIIDKDDYVSLRGSPAPVSGRCAAPLCFKGGCHIDSIKSLLVDGREIFFGAVVRTAIDDDDFPVTCHGCRKQSINASL
jgi:hypothetical protein